MKLEHLFVLLSVVIYVPVWAQETHMLSHEFEEYLKERNIEFLYPIEGAFEMEGNGYNGIFKYQQRMKHKDERLEIFILVADDQGDSFGQYPHLEFHRLIGTVATNKPEKEIMVVTHDSDRLKTTNADWGNEAYFIVKDGVSKYPYGKAVSLYKEGSGLITIIYCFNKAHHLPALVRFGSAN